MKNRIKAEMVRRGLRAHEISQLLGISETAFSYKLNGRSDFTAEELLLLSKEFGLSVDYILKGGALYDSGTHNS